LQRVGLQVMARRSLSLKRGDSEEPTNLEKDNVAIFYGLASFLDKKTVQVEKEGQDIILLEGKKILIATGGEPIIPDIPGADLGITSDGFFELEQQPKRVAIKDDADVKQVEVDCVLWAIGRSPISSRLDVEKLGVELKNRGHIGVDSYQATLTENIFALGDVTGQLELTPVAIAAGRKLSDRLLDPRNFKI
ncbi:Glutathione reductase, partial [Massospora cicadina]